MPSESEWEYVARAGTTGPFHFGSTITTEQANYDGSRYRKRMEPVGSVPANEFGVHDVHGNVRERVEDCGHRNFPGAPTDGSAWTRGTSCDRTRNAWLSSWFDGLRRQRSATRSNVLHRGPDQHDRFQSCAGRSRRELHLCHRGSCGSPEGAVPCPVPVPSSLDRTDRQILATAIA